MYSGLREVFQKVQFSWMLFETSIEIGMSRLPRGDLQIEVHRHRQMKYNGLFPPV